MKFIQTAILSILAFGALASATRCPKYNFKVIKGSAFSPEGLTPVVENFRKLLGGDDNGNNPPTGGKGQRSINWDADIVPFQMPFDFFNAIVPRGAIFTALDGIFAVSNPPKPPPYDDRFSSIVGKAFSKMFVRFSEKRLFTPVRDNAFATTFEIPGSRYKRALTRGFGAVFTDVDYQGPTKVAFFDECGCNIAILEVPARDRGLSFVGLVVFDQFYKQLPAIAKVLISLGEVPISNIISGKDVVVVDDLIYGEPVEKRFEFNDGMAADGDDFGKKEEEKNEFGKDDKQDERKEDDKRDEKKDDNRNEKEDDKREDRRADKEDDNRDDKEDENRDEKREDKSVDEKDDGRDDSQQSGDGNDGGKEPWPKNPYKPEWGEKIHG